MPHLNAIPRLRALTDVARPLVREQVWKTIAQLAPVSQPSFKIQSRCIGGIAASCHAVVARPMGVAVGVSQPSQ